MLCWLLLGGLVPKTALPPGAFALLPLFGSILAGIADCDDAVLWSGTIFGVWRTCSSAVPENIGHAADGWLPPGLTGAVLWTMVRDALSIRGCSTCSCLIRPDRCGGNCLTMALASDVV